MIHHYPCSEKSKAHLGQHGHRSFENSQRESQFFLSPPLHPPLTSLPSESEFNPRIVSFHPQYLLSCPSGTVSQKPFSQGALRSHQMGEHHVNILLHDRLILCLWKHFDEFDGPRTNYLFILFNLQPMYLFLLYRLFSDNFQAWGNQVSWSGDQMEDYEHTKPYPNPLLWFARLSSFIKMQWSRNRCMFIGVFTTHTPGKISLKMKVVIKKNPL